jgi:hypothetical protein
MRTVSKGAYTVSFVADGTPSSILITITWTGPSASSPCTISVAFGVGGSAWPWLELLGVAGRNMDVRVVVRVMAGKDTDWLGAAGSNMGVRAVAGKDKD